MLENIKDLKIKGGCYSGKYYTLENILAQRFNVVYGRNGSGKSSIAEAIDEWANSDSNVSVPRFDLDGSLSDDLKGHVYVFNQKFIDKNLKVASNGIDAIVTLGGQVQVDDEVQAIDAKIKTLQIRKDLEQTTAEQNTKTQNLLATKIEKALKKGDFQAWGEQAMIAIGKKLVKKDLDEIYNTKHTIAQPRKALENEIGNLIAQLGASQNGISVSWSVPTIPFTRDFAQIANTKLATALKKPDESGNLKHVFEIVNKYNYIDDSKKVFKDDSVDICPLCHQPVSEEAKEKLFATIALMRDDTARTFIENVQSILDGTVPLSVSFPSDDEFFKDALTKCKAAENDLNKEIDKILAALKNKQKMENLYKPIAGVNEQSFEKAYDDYVNGLKTLEGLVQQQNNAVNQQQNIANSILDLNKQIAYLTYQSDFDSWHDAKVTAEKALVQAQSLENLIKIEISKKSELEATANNTALALEYINGCLTSVFMNENRMQLKIADDGKHYVLMVRGCSVDPENVSTGERNVIALAYFFSTMLQHKSVDTVHQEEKLVVIDDPISSFDDNNRMGILSLLHRRICDIISGNLCSKMLVLTHDINTVMDLTAIHKSIISKAGDRITNDRGENLEYLELYNCVLSPHYRVKSNTYHRLLEQIINFANEDITGMDDDRYDSIGNQIRRFVELYKDLRYNGDDINKVFADWDIKQKLPESLKNYFIHQNMMMVLHALSHEGNNDDQLPVARRYGINTIQQLVNNLLAFIYFTDGVHIKFVLGYKSNEYHTVKCIANTIRRMAENIVNTDFVINPKKDRLYYENQEFKLEQDRNGNWHCGEDCYLKYDRCFEEGKIIKLGTIKVNTDPKFKYAYFSNDWECVESEDNII